MIHTKTQALAKQAKAAIENGTSWSDAVERYSPEDPIGRSTKGRYPDVTEGSLDPAVSLLAFNGKRGDGGHGNLPVGGHRNSPLAVVGSPRPWPSVLPTMLS